MSRIGPKTAAEYAEQFRAQLDAILEDHGFHADDSCGACRGLPNALLAWCAGIAVKVADEQQPAEATGGEQVQDGMAPEMPPPPFVAALTDKVLATMQPVVAMSVRHLLAEFDAKGRADVVSRELLVRGVEEWRKVAEADRG